jgi:hypothetical protein
MPALATMALIGFCAHANAQARCPELTRLRSEAAAALKQTVPASDRCEAYHRVSMAWGAIAQYASDNRAPCDISIPTLDDFEKYHREAVTARDNVCAGRPAHPYPADIIRR